MSELCTGDIYNNAESKVVDCIVRKFVLKCMQTWLMVLKLVLKELKFHVFAKSLFIQFIQV